MATVFIGILIFAASLPQGRSGITLEPVTVVNQNRLLAIYTDFSAHEGNMGTNQASLDYYDYETGVYARNDVTANATLMRSRPRRRGKRHSNLR